MQQRTSSRNRTGVGYCLHAHKTAFWKSAGDMSPVSPPKLCPCRHRLLGWSLRSRSTFLPVTVSIFPPASATLFPSCIGSLSSSAERWWHCYGGERWRAGQLCMGDLSVVVFNLLRCHPSCPSLLFVQKVSTMRKSKPAGESRGTRRSGIGANSPFKYTL